MPNIYACIPGMPGVGAGSGGIAYAAHSDDQCGDGGGYDTDGIGFGEGGDQAAPLGRAVIGGLIASTFAALFNNTMSQ